MKKKVERLDIIYTSSNNIGDKKVFISLLVHDKKLYYISKDGQFEKMGKDQYEKDLMSVDEIETRKIAVCLDSLDYFTFKAPNLYLWVDVKKKKKLLLLHGFKTYMVALLNLVNWMMVASIPC